MLPAFDRKCFAGKDGIVGIDEVGRGAFAGDVVACAVWIPAAFYDNRPLLNKTRLINDSKQLREEQREDIFRLASGWLDGGHVCFATGAASCREVEELNVVGATRQAMIRAVRRLLELHPSLCLEDDEPLPLLELMEPEMQRTPKLRGCVRIDGRPMADFPWPHEGVIKGDGQSLAIALASVIAKVTRDRAMQEMALKYPAYGFDTNKGYGTPAHLQAILANGPCKLHRKTFLKRLSRPPAPEEYLFEEFAD